MKSKTLIVCDVQPDVVQKLPQPQQQQLFVDLVHTAVAAARRRKSSIDVLYLMLQFQTGYSEVPPSHPRLGILRKLAATSNPNLKQWFTSNALSVTPGAEEKVLIRSTFLPQANDTHLIETLRANFLRHDDDTLHEFILVGYGPTVQALCSLLGDVVAAPNVVLLRECIRDENEERCHLFLEHGLLFKEQVVSLVEFMESLDVLHEKIDLECSEQSPANANNKYVCDWPWLKESLLTISLSTFLNSGGGGTSGLPSEKSKTFSGPCSAFNRAPSSNISLIIDIPSTILTILSAIGMMPSCLFNQQLLLGPRWNLQNPNRVV